MSETYTTLMQQIEQGTANIVVIGLGYVGLPLATELAKAGFSVTGYDLDQHKLGSLSKGLSYVDYPTSEVVGYLIESNALKVTSDPAVLETADVIVVCVPTPLNKNREPDLEMVLSAIQTIKEHSRPGQLVILESTTYPGTTRELVIPKLLGNPQDLGKTTFVAYSPERIDPGNTKYNLNNTPKVVSGATPNCLQLAIRLYFSINENIVPVTSLEVAEMSKILENSFRYVNIALVNELAIICQTLGVNFYEVIDAAETKPYGFMPFYPGPGLGGHCIPVDPLYLTWRLRSAHTQSRFIELADEVNLSMSGHTVDLVIRALNSQQKSVNGSKVLVLGVTYKPNIGDMRESPILPIIAKLRDLGATVYYEDPHVQDHVDFGALKTIDPVLSWYDTVVIATPHKVFDLKKVALEAKTIVDPRGVLRGSYNKLLQSPNIFRF